MASSDLFNLWSDAIEKHNTAEVKCLYHSEADGDYLYAPDMHPLTSDFVKGETIHIETGVWTIERNQNKPNNKMKTQIYTVAVQQDYEEKGKTKTRIVLEPKTITARSEHEAVLKAGRGIEVLMSEEQYDVLVKAAF